MSQSVMSSNGSHGHSSKNIQDSDNNLLFLAPFLIGVTKSIKTKAMYEEHFDQLFTFNQFECNSLFKNLLEMQAIVGLARLKT